METPLINEHRAAGASLAEYSGCTLPASFSGFAAEYNAARGRAAIFDTNWHAVLSFVGPDRARYLNAVLTTNIQALTEGRGTLALLLNAQGHILAELEVYSHAGKFLTLSHASVRERTRTALDKYIIMDDVELQDLTDQVGNLSIEGPSAPAIIQQACGVALEGLPDRAIRDVTIERVPCQLLHRSHFGEPGATLVVRRDRLASLWHKVLAAIRAHGGQPMGTAALNALRLEAGVPWFPADFNDTVIPHEAALEDTHVSFTKGCYTGQEIVERVRSRGHVNRRRVRLKFSVSTTPETNTPLLAGGAKVGHVTSAAFSPATGTAIGMGYVRREHNAPRSSLDVEGGGTAEVMP